MDSLNVAGKKKAPGRPRKITPEVRLWIEAEIRAGRAQKIIISDLRQKFGIAPTLAKQTIAELRPSTIITLEVLLWIEAEIRAGHDQKIIISDLRQKFGIAPTLAKQTIAELRPLMKEKDEARARSRKAEQTLAMLAYWAKGPWRPH